MGKVVKAIKHEMIEIFWVSLYFFIAFGLILVLKILFLSQFNIEFYSISGVIGGALIMGKVVPLLNKTRLTHAFKKNYLIKNILFKTILYSLIADFLFFLEHFIREYVELGSFGETVHEIMENPDIDQTLIVVICSFITLLIFNTFDAINKYLGNKGLFKLLFAKKGFEKI